VMLSPPTSRFIAAFVAGNPVLGTIPVHSGVLAAPAPPGATNVTTLPAAKFDYATQRTIFSLVR
jgi:hypothetical protein